MPKTTQSNEFAAQVAGAANYANVTLDKRDIGGDVRYATVTCVFDGSNVASDVISLVRLPAGAIVLPELSKIIVTDDMTSGALTVHVGDVVDNDRYCVSANCASPGVIDFIASNATTFPAGLTTRHTLDNTGVSTTDTTIITATLATFTATIEAGTVMFVLAFKCL